MKCANCGADIEPFNNKQGLCEPCDVKIDNRKYLSAVGVKDREELAKKLDTLILDNVQFIDDRNISPYAIREAFMSEIAKLPSCGLEELDVESLINTMIWSAGASKQEHIDEYRMMATAIVKRFGRKRVSEAEIEKILEGHITHVINARIKATNGLE